MHHPRHRPSRPVFATGFLCALLALTASGAAATEKPQPAKAASSARAAPDSGHAELRCQPFYTPARSLWVRTVGLDYNQKKLDSMSIDGVKVFSFQINGTALFTAVDNERIQIDTATLQWRSDFRGLAMGEGRCEWVS